MIEGTVHRPRFRVAALFAHAAGVTGIIANLFLLILYIQLGLRPGSSEYASLLGPVGELAGPTNDLLGSLAAAFMIYPSRSLWPRACRGDRQRASRRRPDSS